MIPTDTLRHLPARLRKEARQTIEIEESELSGVLEQAADVADELLRLRRWQRHAALVIDVLRRHATGQEPLGSGGWDQEYWVRKAYALTERRVIDDGAAWEPEPPKEER